MTLIESETRVSRQRYQRAVLAKKQAEELLDAKSRELWEVNQKLIGQADTLEQQVRERTADLTKAKLAAEAANHIKSVFLASMSHEIRTPLNGVLGMAEVLLDSGLNAEQRNMAVTIVDSGQILLAVLNDILDLSKIEAGQLEIEERPFDLAELIRTTCELYKAKAHEKGIALTLTLAPAASCWIASDPVRLRQVLGNMISNAIKFTNEGEVEIIAELRKHTDKHNDLILSVRDTGMGIPKSKLSKLFQPFVQVDASVARKFGGTGLGLSISRQICRMLGGDMTVSSRLNAGSVFTATARVGHAVAADRPAPADQPAGTDIIAARRWRILLAEDNKTNQLVFSKYLQGFDLDITVVENGQAACDAFARGQFDIVFMDVNMPVMDGITATQKIRGIEAAANRPRTPVMALTANTMVHEIEGYLEKGVDRHLGKPIKKATLLAALADGLAMLTEDRGDATPVMSRTAGDG